MIEHVGRPGGASVVDERAEARAAAELRDSPPVARCHPERPMYAVGLCQYCYAEVVRHRSRTADAQLRGAPQRLIGRALSEREVEVLRLKAAGHSNKMAGAELGISEQTVKNHMSSIFRKLDVQTTVEAASRWFEQTHGTVDEAIAALDYLDNVERHLLRLRRDVTNIIGRIRKGRIMVVAIDEPKPEPRFRGDPDRIVPTLKNARKVATTCRRGHPFTEANTRITSKGTRACRACHATYAREKYRTLRDLAAKGAAA